MLRQIATWLPTVLLALLVALDVATGAGLELTVVVALIAIQAALVGLPRAADAAGRWYGERTSE